jgi:4-amino-4-deoxy-L-arabinose transferase-like glycosyltransferase
MIRRNPTALAILCLLLTSALGILLRPLTPIDETRYLAVAWEMHLTGDWLVPSKNFAPYSDKPPLLFWAINLVWMLTGVSEFWGRMVVPLFTCLAVWLTAVLARALWPGDSDIGGRAALALAGLAVFAISGGLTMFDMPLAVATLAGLLCLHRGSLAVQAGRFGAGPWAGFGAAVALGVLIKGPVILFHLMPAALLLPLWTAGGLPWRALPLRLGFGLGVAMALLSLWLVPAAILGGEEYRDAILWHQSAGRLASSFAHARPWWFYLALLPALLFPLGWSPALWRAGWQARWRQDAGLRLCLIWTAAALVLFSLTSGKQIHYLVPELPAVALVAARLSGPLPRFGLWPAAVLLGMLAAVAVLASLGVIPLGGMADFLAPRSALLAWALLVLALCWLALQRRGAAGAMLLSLGGVLATNLLIAVTATGTLYSTHPIAALIGPERAQGIAYVGSRYHAEFNFAARLTAPVTEASDLDGLRGWAADHPDGLIIAHRGADEPPWPPQTALPYRGDRYGLWSVAEAPGTQWRTR